MFYDFGPFDIGPDDFQPELPPEPECHGVEYDPDGSGDWVYECRGGGYDTEPGTDPFGFACWLDGLIQRCCRPCEMLATAPPHLLWVIRR